ncbi:MAG TPA: hypothetical protein VNX86_04650 [Rhizomicrobium sp.]|jgi:hypothetical protein|nr:hypothetical protein [Rhizomicrobium sp.]
MTQFARQEQELARGRPAVATENAEPHELRVSASPREALSSLAQDWCDFFGRSDAAQSLAQHLALKDSDADCAVFHHLTRIGAFVAGIVPEEKLELGTVTAPRFRWAMSHEMVPSSIVVPVWGDDACAFLFPASAHDDAEDRLEFITGHLCDLVALGPRPRSLTGLTMAIGLFGADDAGRVVVHGSGRAWLDAHLAFVRRMVAQMPPRIAAREAGQPRATLLIEPAAFDWTGVVAPRAPYVLPAHAKTLFIPDSRALAAHIARAMKAPAQRVTRPQVFAPKGTG